MDCYWLQISDLHYSESSKDGFRLFALQGAGYSGAENIHDGGLKWVLENMHKEGKELSCIVFTGDLFDKGKWTAATRDKALRGLKEIYKMCNRIFDWGWSENESMDRFFYCPGNHDLNRNAECENDGIIETRDSILNSIISSIDHSGNLQVQNDEYYKLLTEKTFGGFYNAIERVCQSVSAQNADIKYEAQVFSIGVPKGKAKTKTWKVCFVGINTCLTAGKSYPDNEWDNEIVAAYQKYHVDEAKLNFDEAVMEYQNYIRIKKLKAGRIVNDANHLCMPQSKTLEKIQKIIEEENPEIVVLFGHHPTSFFSSEAIESLKELSIRIKSRIYLCGHTHRPSVSGLFSIDNSAVSEIHQITTGGFFNDPSGYNLMSFCIGKLSEPKDNLQNAELYVKTYCCYEDGRKIQKWVVLEDSASIGLAVDGNQTTGTDNSNATFDSPQNQTIHDNEENGKDHSEEEQKYKETEYEQILDKGREVKKDEIINREQTFGSIELYEKVRKAIKS